MPPFFLKRGAMAPFLRRSTPFWKKRGEERGEVYKKGGNDTDRKIPIPAVSDTGKYRYRKNDWNQHGIQLYNFATVCAPPPWLLLAISQPKIKLQNRRSNPTGRQDSTHIAVARRCLSPPFASAQASLWQNRRPDDEGRNGGATMKAAAARRGRQRQRDDKGRNGGATTKGAAAR